MNLATRVRPETPSRTQAEPTRFTRRREEVVAAATRLLNERGVKGTTLADVAGRVGLITTSVTYYFRKKEDLAAACFLSGVSRYEALVDAVAGEGASETAPLSAEERLRRFLQLFLDLKARIRRREEPPLPAFDDMRVLTEPHLGTVTAAYARMFRKLRALLWGTSPAGAASRTATARTHVLLEQLFWARIWLRRYEVEDHPRIHARMCDILINGFAPGGAPWPPPTLPEAAAGETAAEGREQFLVAATRLISREGYRGASVEKISAELKITKSSFYHHNEGKDDLVVQCFDRTFRLMREAQSAAMRLPADEWTRLAAAAAALVDRQLADDGPLLRSSAYSALPSSLRAEVVRRSHRCRTASPP